jgi:DNA primase
MKEHVLYIVEKYLGRGHYSGDANIQVKCPFHKGGQETKPSFGINVTNGIWNCFACKRTGTLPKLLKELGLPKNIVDLELEDIRTELASSRKALSWKKREQWHNSDPFLAETILPESLLRPFEYCPTSLIQAGFSSQWLQWMDIGYDTNNSRITYPIRDIYGNLTGISGGATIAGQYPKYKVYQGPRRDFEGKHIVSDYGPWFDETYPDYSFRNHNYLWNFDQVYPRLFFSTDEDQSLIIVEGFKACLWLLQNGWSNTVALMGSAMSDHQRNLIHRVSARVVLFLDNDQAGRDGTDKIARKIQAFNSRVTIAHYPYADECQPDDLTPSELIAAIQGSESHSHWKRRLTYVNGQTEKNSTDYNREKQGAEEER